MITSEMLYDGRRVEPGAVWLESTDALKLQVQTRCESVTPLLFCGLVMFDGVPLLVTDAQGSKEQAAAAARTAFRERVVKALGTPSSQDLPSRGHTAPDTVDWDRAHTDATRPQACQTCGADRTQPRNVRVGYQVGREYLIRAQAVPPARAADRTRQIARDSRKHSVERMIDDESRSQTPTWRAPPDPPTPGRNPT